MAPLFKKARAEVSVRAGGERDGQLPRSLELFVEYRYGDIRKLLPALALQDAGDFDTTVHSLFIKNCAF